MSQLVTNEQFRMSIAAPLGLLDAKVDILRSSRPKRAVERLDRIVEHGTLRVPVGRRRPAGSAFPERRAQALTD